MYDILNTCTCQGVAARQAMLCCRHCKHPPGAAQWSKTKHDRNSACLSVFALQYAISKVGAAASKILSLSSTTCSQPGASPVKLQQGRSKRSFAEFADADAVSDGAQQQKCRQESIAWPSAEFSDEEELNSQAAASPACVGSELLQLGGKCQQDCAPASAAQHRTGGKFLLEESQEE
jgi:hypothetical protein